MWCDQCQCDVKTVASPLGGPTCCIRCGRELGTNMALPGGGPRPDYPTTSAPRRPDARDLLDRWSRADTPTGQPSQGPAPATPSPINSSPVQSTPAAPQRSSQVPVQRVPTSRHDAGVTDSPAIGSGNWPAAPTPTAVRFDAPHAATPSPPGWVAPPEGTPSPPGVLGRPSMHSMEGPEPQRTRDGHWQQPHAAHPAVPPPHFPASEITSPATTSSSLWAGQIISLMGVMGLILGVLLLLYTHFLAAQRDALLAPGWVIAAVSQLFLLLGVVMNISAGLNQTNREVAWRVTALTERLHRIETGGPPSASN